MEFTNGFVVPSDIDTTYATLADIERVASCLPGAVLDHVDGDAVTGSFTVRVGPACVTYQGTARLTDVDATARRGRIEVSGQEARGPGTASATIDAQLTEVPGGTRVAIVSDLRLTGKAAQFGRGILGDAGLRLVGTFADRLRAALMVGDVSGGEGATVTPMGHAPPGRGDPLDDTGAGTRTRVVTLVLGIVTVAAALRWWRRDTSP